MKNITSGSSLSIIVPTLNEEHNVTSLTKRIVATMSQMGVDYELIFVDDHSSDQTIPTLTKLAEDYPIRIFVKTGQRGKAYSLLQGAQVAKYETVCMIDADLQYPPEAIAPMLDSMIKNGAQLVTTTRSENQTSALRRLTSRGFNFMFCRLLFGIKEDTQSGLKLCKKAHLMRFVLSPSPWSFDLELVARMRKAGHIIVSYPIAFARRESGESKAKVLGVSYELAKSSLKLKLQMLLGSIGLAATPKVVSYE